MVCLVLVAAIGATLWQVSRIGEESDRIANLRVPTAAASARMTNNINASLATLRGWMLTGNEAFKAERAAVWADIDAAVDEMNRLSANWTNSANVERWQNFKTTLAAFRVAQANVETIAHSPDAFPATRVLVEDAAPRASALFAEVTVMIDIEQTLAATPARKELLGIMADIRGTVAGGLAGIRAYLLTGDEAFRRQFEQLWQKNSQRFADLSDRVELLNPGQKAAYDKFAEARSGFAPLPPKMFEIRSSAKWNMANWTLVQEAAPRAGKLLDILLGELTADGARSGGMVANQRLLLEEDATAVSAQIDELTIIEVVLLIVGLVICVAVVVITNRAIATPLIALRAAVEQVRGGGAANIPGLEKRGEIGALARALDEFCIESVAATRIKAALDQCQASVMVADADLNIVYLNETLEQMLRVAQNDIRTALPQFDIDRLIGANIDSFHKNPAHQRGMLASLSEAYKTEINIGGRTFSPNAAPVLGVRGQRLGTVVEWRDRTQELAIEAEVDAVVEAVTGGNVAERLSIEGKNGFMRRLAERINQLTTVVADVSDDLGQMLASLAKGDLSHRIETAYQGKFDELKDNANRTADQLADIVAQMQAATGEVANAAVEINSGTSDLSQRTEQAATNLEETAASTEEMAATVKQNAENAKDANQLADRANQSASSGGAVVERVVDAMSAIESSAQKITDIIVVIDEIAFQTNLLALNASVEAARAGEAGKGFAVVAQEVRQLAQRSAQAAADIKTLIQDSNGQVKEGVQLVNQAGGALSEIVESIDKVADIVRGISDASQEQASGVQEINGAVTSMDEMTQQNSALVEESTAASRALSDQAGKLAELMAFFKLDGRAAPKPTGRAATSRPAKPAPTTKTQPVIASSSDNSWDEF